MSLVAFALRRPISILVLVIAAILTSILAIARMPRDVFPNLGVPVLYVAQPYGGMDPAQMEGFLVNYYEYHFLYINGIEHVESKSIQDRKSTRLNSSHRCISYAVFCLKKKKQKTNINPETIQK